MDNKVIIGSLATAAVGIGIGVAAFTSLDK